MVSTAVHEERHGAGDKYCGWHRRSGDCQRYFERVWHRSWRMVGLPNFKLHRRMLADLDRPDGSGGDGQLEERERAMSLRPSKPSNANPRALASRSWRALAMYSAEQRREL